MNFRLEQKFRRVFNMVATELAQVEDLVGQAALGPTDLASGVTVESVD